MTAIRSSIKLALETLRLNPLRTTLSTLGIIMGAASLAAVLALADGGERLARESIERQGLSSIFLRPQTERIVSKVSTGEMWREAARPLFLVLFICNGFWAAVELGPDQWFPTVMGQLVPGLQGVIFLVYTAGLMFVVRSLGSSISQRSPVGTLVVSTALTFVGLYWLGGLTPGARRAS